jgi:hypothetical protein
MNIFNLSDEDNLTDKINLDDLFEKKREIADSKLTLYNKILNRIHNKIKITSRQNRGKEQFIWYTIPEIMIGVSRYNVEECTGYILRKLRENDFVVRYTHPNLIFISWIHWIPGYVRQEYKKQTGTAIDGYGNIVNNDPQIENGISSSGADNSSKPTNPDDLLLNKQNKNVSFSKDKDKDFNSIKNYKPTGIYNNDILKKIQDKFSPSK